MLKFLLKNINFKKGLKVLDVGGGPLARFSIEFAKLGLHVTWLDVSKTALIIAKQKINSEELSNKIKLCLGDATKLNLKEKFDIIFCFDTFYHIPSYLSLKTLENFHKHLKKDGILVLNFAFKKYSLFDKLYELYLFLYEVLKGPYPITVVRYDENEIMDMLSRAGFKLLNKNNGLFLLKPLRKSY